MSRTRRLLLVVAALAGWAAALVAAYVLVQLRYRWGGPASAAASSGARAFGDVTLILAVFGVLSLPATWALLAALRDAAAAWRALSWSGLAWTAVAPVSLVVRFVAALPRGDAAGPWTVPLEAANAYAFIRLLATPALVPAIALAWWVCRDDASARRLRWAFAFEAAGLGGLVAFLGAALLRGGT
jgi:hypothetical protein